MSVKKTLISVASYALVGALAIGGTVAYLSDRSTATNAFTVGDVEIQLNEDFVQGSELLPGNKVKKEVSIENTGDNDAWVWYTYATPVATSNMGGSASKNIVHINIPGAYWGNSDKDATKGQYYKEEKYWVDGQTEPVDWEDTWCVAPFDATRVQTIKGVEYYIQPVLYNGTIEPGEVTNIGMNTVYLDTHIDYNKNDGKYYWVEKGEVTPINDADYDLANYKMYVAAYAVQDTDEIDNVQEAYDAFMKQWTDDEGKMEVTYDEPVAVTSTEKITTAIANGATTIQLAAGQYTIPAGAVKGKEISFIGTGEDTVIDCTEAQDVSGAQLSFANLKIQGKNANYIGYEHAASVVYENCVIENQITLYASDVKFNNCKFRMTGGYLWTYGADNVEFTNCVFNNTDSRAILVYQESDSKVCNVTVKDCTFNADANGYTGSGDWTAAIEIDSSLAPANVVIENCKADENYNGIVRNKAGVNTTITLDGVEQPINNN